MVIDSRTSNFNRNWFNAMKESAQYVGLDVYDIIGEWVESPELTELPKALQIELCKSLRRFHDSISIISYEKILSILEDYDYPWAEDVKSSMKQFDSLHKSCLLLVSVDVDPSEDFRENKTLKFIKENYNDAYGNAYEIFMYIYNNKDAEGLTVFHRDEFDPANKFTCIFINRKAASMKDTLEHELTHFVKRVAMYSNKFPKTYSIHGDRKLVEKISENISKIFKAVGISSTKLSYQLFKLVASKMMASEEHETAKSIINAVIRRYEKSSEKFNVNHKMLSISQIESSGSSDAIASTRIEWLKKFLRSLSSFEFFRENAGVLEEASPERDFYLKCITYVCFRECFPEYCIDKLLEENFKKFKFRDV